MYAFEESRKDVYVCVFRFSEEEQMHLGFTYLCLLFAFLYFPFVVFPRLLLLDSVLSCLRDKTCTPLPINH